MMRDEFILGIDIGTTATKVILIDLKGNLVAEASRSATLYTPQAGRAEEDPEEWWGNLRITIPACLERAQIQPTQVLAVGASGMVPTIILVDRTGRPLRRSIQQNDARSHAEIEYFQTRVDTEEIFRRTGSAITQQSIGPKLLWIARNEPTMLEETRWVMGSYDFIGYRLTGEPTLERNWALESGLFDLYTQNWIDDLLSLASISRSQLPPVHYPSEVIGKVSPKAAKETGLVPGLPVVAGSADHVASAFSAGLKENGDLLVKLGGAGDILYSLDRLEVDPRLFIDYHVIPDLYLLNGCMASSGSIIKWFRQHFAPGTNYKELDAEAEDIPAGAQGLMLLPYFIGEKTPVFDPLARGVLFGLTFQHSRAHIYRSILEGISFGFYHHLEVLSERGLGVRRVRAANGGARSRLWRQVTADVLGLSLEEVAHHPGSSLGAAFVAGMGVEAFNNWDEIENYIQLASTTHPDMERHARYRKLYDLYRQIYEANKDNFQDLARLEGLI